MHPLIKSTKHKLEALGYKPQLVEAGATYSSSISAHTYTNISGIELKGFPSLLAPDVLDSDSLYLTLSSPNLTILKDTGITQNQKVIPYTEAIGLPLYEVALQTAKHLNLTSATHTEPGSFKFTLPDQRTIKVQTRVSLEEFGYKERGHPMIILKDQHNITYVSKDYLHTLKDQLQVSDALYEHYYLAWRDQFSKITGFDLNNPQAFIVFSTLIGGEKGLDISVSMKDEGESPDFIQFTKNKGLITHTLNNPDKPSALAQNFIKAITSPAGLACFKQFPTALSILKAQKQKIVEELKSEVAIPLSADLELA